MATIRSSQNIKGVQNIYTHSGKTGQSEQLYQIYLRIGVLEMEKARRAKEREGAIARINSIDNRFREIDAEKKALLKTVAEDQCNPLPKLNGNQKNTAGSFKIRYYSSGQMT